MVTEARTEAENIAIFGGVGSGEIPERFTTDSPGKTDWYHTAVCGRVVTGLKNRATFDKLDYEEIDISARLREVNAGTIQWHGLDHCPQCRDLAADE